MRSTHPPIRILCSLLLCCASACHARIFTFEMHHRYSDQVKIWSQMNARSNSFSSAAHWPARGSVEYYSQLAERDRLFRGRRITEIEEPVTFSSGNDTVRISSLGFLHYTTVTLGTPGAKFLVALDTGSDLFWVPCDCNQCAPVKGTSYASDFDLSIYNPKDSSTSKKVNCNNSLCLLRNKCTRSANQCPYLISYVSAETSTSGILVEDVLHLTTEDHHREFVEAYITFGCGQVQTGSFLDVAAPNGLFGLGMEKISVPSLLSRESFTADSFSMCFSQDGVGRISFGDRGSPQQRETPFNFNPSHPTYNITVTHIQVGDLRVDLNFTALFDSGTSFTYLVDPAYSKLVDNFHSQAKDARRPPDSRIPFEYCYDMSPEANTSLIPSITLIMNGGSQFPVYDPVIVISTQNELVYCLAVVKSTELNIIGQNFMTGYRVVFDREKLILGWEKSNCLFGLGMKQGHMGLTATLGHKHAGYNIQVFASVEEAGNATNHDLPAAAVEPKRSGSDSAQGTTQNSSSSPRMLLVSCYDACDIMGCLAIRIFLLMLFSL